LSAIQGADMKSSAADEDYHNLAADHNDIDGDEEPISMYAFEDVEFVV
jgi:hypothetical protein